jgi:hypothetical protein
MEFEVIVADMPEHSRAIEGLERARARVEEERRRQLAAQLLQDAREALGDGGYTLCLEILKQAEEISPPADAVRDIAALRETAEAGLAAREAARRARRGGRARSRADGASAGYRAVAGQPTACPGAMERGESTSADAQDAFTRESYEEARQGLRRRRTATDRLRRRRARRNAESGKLRNALVRRSTACRERARAADAPRYARDLWDAAEAKLTEGRAHSTRRRSALRPASSPKREVFTAEPRRLRVRLDSVNVGARSKRVSRRRRRGAPPRPRPRPSMPPRSE